MMSDIDFQNGFIVGMATRGLTVSRKEGQTLVGYTPLDITILPVIELSFGMLEPFTDFDFLTTIWLNNITPFPL